MNNSQNWGKMTGLLGNVVHDSYTTAQRQLKGTGGERATRVARTG